MNSLKKAILGTNIIMPILIFFLAVIFRLFLFGTLYPNERHSYAGYYGSAAIGLYTGGGLTFNLVEVYKIDDSTRNIEMSKNFITLKNSNERKKWLYGLAGPVYTLAILWNLTHIYNFIPYIFLQILLDSLIIALFFIGVKKYFPPLIIYFLIFFLVFNSIAISKTLSVSYDFWAPFSVLIGFIGLLYAFSKNNNNHIMFLTGLFTALTLWFRDIINFLPFYLATGIIFFYWFKRKESLKKCANKVAIYLFPVLISMFLLSFQRYQTTGSLRPTQTFFWHAFFAAVAQFDNPYGITNTDAEIWAFGHRLNSEVTYAKEFEYSENPSNIYEETLKKEGLKFINEHPFLFLRNMIYRTGIMIAPTFFTVSSSSLSNIFNNIFSKITGVILIILWICGMYHLFKTRNTSLYVIIPIYLYFFSIFSWYYLVGRVILCFAFINIIVYLYGIYFLYLLFISNKQVIKP